MWQAGQRTILDWQKELACRRMSLCLCDGPSQPDRNPDHTMSVHIPAHTENPGSHSLPAPEWCWLSTARGLGPLVSTGVLKVGNHGGLHPQMKGLPQGHSAPELEAQDLKWG